MDFEQEQAKLFNKIGIAKHMVLATALNDKVTARMVSCIIIDAVFYFQTDKNLIKYKQIEGNKRVAFCIDNIQIEGVASVQGHPLDNQNGFFAEALKSHYKGTFDAYSPLADEVLIKVTPTFITIWDYEDGKPYRLFFDFSTKTVSKEYYEIHTK